MKGFIWDLPLRIAGAFFTAARQTDLQPRPPTGAVVYVEETNSIWRFSGTAWAEIGGAGAGTITVSAPLTYNGGVLAMPKASLVQDGYLAALDYAAFIAAGTQVKITSADTTPGYLSVKVTAGSGLSAAVVSPGGSEVLHITNTDRGTVAVGSHEGAYPHANIPSTPSIPADDGKVWTAQSGVGVWATAAGSGASFNKILTLENGPDGLPLTLNGMPFGPCIVCDNDGNVMTLE